MRAKTVILATLLFWLAVSAGQAEVVSLDKVIAIVNDEAVTRSEYESRYRRKKLETNKNVAVIPAQIDEAILELLIEEKLQIQQAEALGITVSDADIDNALGQMARQNNMSADQLVTALNQEGITPAQLRQSIREQTLIRRTIEVAINSRVNVSEEEIDYHLQAHKELYTTDESYELSHIFVSISGKSEEQVQSELENIEHIHAGLLSGLSFSDAARDYSDGENKGEGGYLGWRTEDQLPELFLDALRDTPIGGISDVLESSNGFHILKVHSKEGDINIVTQHLVRHILIQPNQRGMTNEEAIELLDSLAQQIRSGEDFSQLARLNSDDQESGSNGGDLGWVSPGELAPRLEKVVGEIPVNQVSDPVRSVFGFHIVEVLDRRKKDISHNLARKKAEQEVFRRKAGEQFQNWFNRIRDGAYIEYVADS